MKNMQRYLYHIYPSRKAFLAILACLPGVMNQASSAVTAEPRFTLPLTEITALGANTKVRNGNPTTSYPEVGALLARDAGAYRFSCSGTMIGCQRFLIAAHCVCPSTAFPSGSVSTGQQCEKAPPKKGDFEVFLQHFGLFSVADISWPARYEKPGGKGKASIADVAIVTLAKPVTGVRPRLLNDVAAPPEEGDENAVIVGFGRTNQGVASYDHGIKRDAALRTKRCKPGFPKGEVICWNYRAGTNEANSCPGDSGGPLFQNLGRHGERLTGVTSGGVNACDQDDQAYDANVFTNITWLQTTLGEPNHDDVCGGGVGLPSGGDETLGGRYSGATGEFTPSKRIFRYTFAVADATLLRVTVNGIEDINSDVDLYVVPGKNQDDVKKAMCKQDSVENFGVCEVDPKEQQEWTVIVQPKSGNGKFQVTATLF